MTFTNTTNPNSPDYKPEYEERTGVVFIEKDNMIIDVSGTVLNERVYDITGVIIHDDEHEMALDDKNYKDADILFDINLEQLIYEDAHNV